MSWKFINRRKIQNVLYTSNIYICILFNTTKCDTLLILHRQSESVSRSACVY